MELILQKLLDIFNVTISADKTREVLAVESVRMEADAMLIVRLCEELLLVSRSLRETWTLGTLKIDAAQPPSDPPQSLSIKFNELTDKIAAFEKIEL